MKAIFAIVLVLFLLLQYKLWFEDDSIRTARHLQQQVDEQIEKNDHLEARNMQLATEVDELKYGQTATEEHARQELGMIKGNEEFIRVVESGD